MEMWDNLIKKSHNISLPLLVIGDFNEITFNHEKVGGNQPKLCNMMAYRETMEKCNLTDLGFVGNKFTWFNKRKNRPIFERLDRCWASPDWMLQYPLAVAQTLPRLSSDHNPIFLNFRPSPPSPYKKFLEIEPSWFFEPTFDETVIKTWAGLSQNLDIKLFNLADTLTNWAGLINNFSRDKKRTQARLNEIQLALENDPCNSFLFDLENELQIKFEHLLNQEESYWQCRSCTNWLMLGDKNTHFFHLSTIIRRKQNRIVSIKK